MKSDRRQRNWVNTSEENGKLKIEKNKNKKNKKKIGIIASYIVW